MVNVSGLFWKFSDMSFRGEVKSTSKSSVLSRIYLKKLESIRFCMKYTFCIIAGVCLLVIWPRANGQMEWTGGQVSPSHLNFKLKVVFWITLYDIMPLICANLASKAKQLFVANLSTWTKKNKKQICFKQRGRYWRKPFPSFNLALTLTLFGSSWKSNQLLILYKPYNLPLDTKSQVETWTDM